MLKVVSNAVIFQAGWLLSVVYGSWMALLVVLVAGIIFIAFYLRCKAEVMLILSITLCGLAGDTILGLSGTLRYPSALFIPPFWMVALWLLFASSIPWSLRWVANRKPWFILFCMAGGPFSYYVGVSLSAVSFGPSNTASIAALVALWLIHGFLIEYFYQKWQHQIPY